MSKLPVVSGDKAIKVFIKLGYVKIRQRGSHIRLKHPTDIKKRPLSVPRHKFLGPGLLRGLIRDANISAEEFRNLL